MTQQQEELDQIKSKIQDHLIASGNYEVINKQLKLQLYESGWYDKVAQIANKELNKSVNNDTDKGGHASTINLNQLYALVRPKAEELVPSDVKENIMKKIEKYLDGIIDE
ncbi:SUS1 [Candida oxycetoniae]|uniref:Transcription and mRNA export factor SUS1 n=1 Tax=Candida oxycetoniae TaxID=497107 RepID=A0AAI9WZ46_9ASCO|nr:SUS1 [Candida oxycetoniae]KAI3405679.2 SUS1 [Candida oxycetoniae]